jgi:hypothetical protein
MRWEWLGRCLRILILANVLRIFLLLELFGLCGLLAALLGRLGRGNVLVVRGLYIAESGCRRASVCTVQARVGMYSTGAVGAMAQWRRGNGMAHVAWRSWRVGCCAMCCVEMVAGGWWASRGSSIDRWCSSGWWTRRRAHSPLESPGLGRESFGYSCWCWRTPPPLTITVHAQ